MGLKKDSEHKGNLKLQDLRNKLVDGVRKNIKDSNEKNFRQYFLH